jgi:hypothetical protein
MAFTPIPREKVLTVIEKVGPVQPIDVRRELREGDTVLIGAILSEMTANAMVAISKTRRGGSPFYYDPKKPETLAAIAQYLGEKDKRTFDLLQAHGILREDAVEPLTRVSLGNIPDFSRRFTVALNGTDVAFWRYYLVSEQDAIAKATGAKKAPTAPIVEAAPKKAARKRAPSKRAKKAAAPDATQATLAPVADALLDKVKMALNGVTEVTIIKPETELTCVHAHAGPHGQIHTFVYASAKRLTEKAVLAQLLAARSRGMPLLVLSTDDVSKKLMELFDETPNVYHKRI